MEWKCFTCEHPNKAELTECEVCGSERNLYEEHAYASKLKIKELELYLRAAKGNLTKKQNEAEILKREINELSVLIKSQSEQLRTTKVKQDELQALVKGNESKISELNSQIVELEKSSNEKKVEIANLQKVIRQKDSEILELKKTKIGLSENQNTKNTAIIVLFIVLILSILISVGIHKNSEESNINAQDSLKQKVQNLESQKNNLQNEIDVIKSNESTTEGNLTYQIQSLKVVLSQLGKKIPITINEITFNSINERSEVIKAQSNFFSKNEVEYIQPVLKFNSNLELSTQLNFYYKIFSPNGDLLLVTNSPSNYTWYNNIYVRGNFGNDNTESLSPIGISCPYCEIGPYNFELWINDNLIDKAVFTITEN